MAVPATALQVYCIGVQRQCYGNGVVESGQHEELRCLQSSSKLNRLTYPGTTTFFIIDCGQRMCLDNLPRKLKSRCTPLQNKLLGIRKFARCISSHKKLDLSIYAQIGGTITPKPWRKQKFLNNCWHVLEQKIRMRGDAGQNTSNTIYRNFDLSKYRKFQ